MLCLRNFASTVSGHRGLVEVKALCTFWTKSCARPNVDLDEYWGPSNKQDTVRDESIRKFRIECPQEKINELNRKLSEKYVFTRPLDGAKEHEYGMDSNKLQEYIRYWRDDYLPRWDERLEVFNSLPHFKTTIQG